ncbi:putative kelch domain-containing protein 10-like [Apostichopus japonicus]|uniref:Putative kelch domain-containing protein 10-like n=1 Tax=Stichopus japonicus TaxID=307972 RepID=A0A2G8JIA4_STIJA|nr:putative kelch domain-containing protein 10-like [Apostichopus japonicus]
MPSARSGHAAVANNKNLYIYGGYNPDHRETLPYNPLFKEMWKFNFDDQSWQLIQNRGTTPFQLASMSMVRCGDIIVLYGGTGYPFGFQKSSSLYCFDIKDNRWRVMSGSKQLPESTYGQVPTSLCSEEPAAGTTLQMYTKQTQDRVWEKCFDFEKHITMLVKGQLNDDHVPYPRYRHEMLSDEENFYVIGGGTSLHAFGLETIHVFNTKLYEWKNRITLADPVHGFPTKRRCHGCCQLGNNGYITGGFNGRRIFDDIWRLSIDTLQWMKLDARLPEPVYFHSSAITPEGCLYCHGGVITQNGSKRTDKLNFIWVSVPSLVTIAWRRILKFNPSVRKLSDEALRGLGIPQHIVKR